MWIRVATNPDSFKVGHGGNKYIDGEHVNEYYFDESVADSYLFCSNRSGFAFRNRPGRRSRRGNYKQGDYFKWLKIKICKV